MADTSDDMEFQRATECFESRRIRERHPKSSAQLISRLIARRGFAQTQSNEQLQTAWLKVVDAGLANKTKPTAIKRGTLEITANSSTAMQQLAFSKTTLLKQIQKQLPDAGIRSIRFRTGNID